MPSWMCARHGRRRTVAAGTRIVLSPKTGVVLDFRRTTLEFADGTFFEGVPLNQTLNSRRGPSRAGSSST